MKAIFLDRDATVNVGIPKYERVDAIEKVELLPHTMEGLSILAGLDFGIFFITNQAGLAEGLISFRDFTAINNKVLQMIDTSGARVIKTYVCPHGLDDNCECRKPGTKTVLVKTGAVITRTSEADYVAADLFEAARYIASH